MGRLGTRAPAAEIVAALEVTPARADRGTDDAFRLGGRLHQYAICRQLDYFKRIAAAIERAGYRGLRLHTSSTNAIAYGCVSSAHNLVRAGHALYGYVSPARGQAPAQRLEVQPALTWKARLLAVKDLPEGALVGYGGTFRTPRAMRIGVLGRRLRGWHLPPPFEPRPGDRRRQADAHFGNDFDGPDHHRPQPHQRPGPRRRSHPARPGRRRAAGRPSRSRAWPAPSFTTFCAASVPAYAGSTCNQRGAGC